MFKFLSSNFRCPYCQETCIRFGVHIRKRHPIDCREVQNLGKDFLDFKVSGEVDMRIACHLEACESCKDFIEKLRNKLNE